MQSWCEKKGHLEPSSKIKCPWYALWKKIANKKIFRDLIFLFYLATHFIRKLVQKHNECVTLVWILSLNAMIKRFADFLSVADSLQLFESLLNAWIETGRQLFFCFMSVIIFKRHWRYGCYQAVFSPRVFNFEASTWTFKIEVISWLFLCHFFIFQLFLFFVCFKYDLPKCPSVFSMLNMLSQKEKIQSLCQKNDWMIGG